MLDRTPGRQEQEQLRISEQLLSDAMRPLVPLLQWDGGTGFLQGTEATITGWEPRITRQLLLTV